MVADIYISEYEISTDHSLLPWESSKTDSGIFIENVVAAVQRKTTSNDLYFELNIIKNDFKL